MILPSVPAGLWCIVSPRIGETCQLTGGIFQVTDRTTWCAIVERDRSHRPCIIITTVICIACWRCLCFLIGRVCTSDRRKKSIHHWSFGNASTSFYKCYICAGIPLPIPHLLTRNIRELTCQIARDLKHAKSPGAFFWRRFTPKRIALTVVCIKSMTIIFPKLIVTRPFPIVILWLMPGHRIRKRHQSNVGALCLLIDICFCYWAIKFFSAYIKKDGLLTCECCVVSLQKLVG